MSDVIPISIAKYTEEYSKLSRQLDALELALLELQSYESELRQRKIKLEAKRRELEALALKSLFKEEK
jgi:hypothetical protein